MLHLPRGGHFVPGVGVNGSLRRGEELHEAVLHAPAPVVRPVDAQQRIAADPHDGLAAIAHRDQPPPQRPGRRGSTRNGGGVEAIGIEIEFRGLASTKLFALVVRHVKLLKALPEPEAPVRARQLGRREAPPPRVLDAEGELLFPAELSHARRRREQRRLLRAPQSQSSLAPELVAVGARENRSPEVADLLAAHEHLVRELTPHV
mmetsp:Transcript_30909/g.81930  ORF Transcript_30909/g.81930 Transcript_30909/m.81930 type:complete len:205 (-) Transcript_30909:67-681(-)